MPENLTREIRVSRVDRKIPRFLSRDEAAQLLAATEDPELRAMLQFALGTGLRCGELVMLQYGDVRLDTGNVHVRAEHAKGRADRLVPLSSWARDAFASMPPRPPFSLVWPMRRDVASRRAKQACVRAGLRDAHLHTMRHTFASWLRLGGAPIDRIQYWLGHTNITTTMIYAHIRPHEIAGELERALSGRDVGALLPPAKPEPVPR